MEFLKRLVVLEKAVLALMPSIQSRAGTYIGKVIDISDPLLYGRVKAVLNDGTQTTWLWKASSETPQIDDAVLVTYTTDTDTGYWVGIVYPRLIERIVTPIGETQPDGITELFSQPRMSEFPDNTP